MSDFINIKEKLNQVRNLEKEIADLEEDIKSKSEDLNSMREELKAVQRELIPPVPDFLRSGAYVSELIADNHRHFLNAERRNVEEFHPAIDDVFFMFHTLAENDEFWWICRMNALLMHCKHYLDPDWDPDWDNPIEDKWAVVFDNLERKYVTTPSSSLEHVSVWFSTREKATLAAEWLTKHISSSD